VEGKLGATMGEPPLAGAPLYEPPPQEIMGEMAEMPHEAIPEDSEEKPEPTPIEE